jgi:hypothetical protein
MFAFQREMCSSRLLAPPLISKFKCRLLPITSHAIIETQIREESYPGVPKQVWTLEHQCNNI